MLQAMRRILLSSQLFKAYKNKSCLNTSNNPRDRYPRQRERGDGPNFRPRRNTSKYCWSHGACAHEGVECTATKPGHKDSATFANKQGGSNAYCGNRGSRGGIVNDDAWTLVTFKKSIKKSINHCV